MNTKQVYHYVYRITNIVEKRHYYGKRSSKINPKLDLGIKYFSSSKDKDFLQDQKLNSDNYKYKVIRIYKTGKEALIAEIKLHNKFDVGVNPSFYNRVKQTSTGFDYTGKHHSKAAKEKISAAQKGKHVSEATREKMSITTSGINHYRVRLVNIYCRYTNNLIAENVVIPVWAASNGYHKNNLHSTAKADRSKPSNSANRHYHKGVYAVYV